MTGDETRAGNYFVSNYPPFSVWSPEAIGAVDEQLEAAPAADVPLGLYIHLPFCRKRCDFCYFKVYTDKSSADIRTYLDALARELSMFATRPYLAGRRPSFVYFGGGTPSYLSATQLRELFGGLREILTWDAA
jgi:oxygen-independent coproporphyrinogen-3 oxidase